MSKIISLLLALVAVVSFTLSACSKGGKSLVKVGGTSITEQDLDLLARVNPRLKPRLATPEGRQKVLENYVEQEMLYQESKNRGLDRTTEAKEKLSLYEKIIVAQALLDQELDKRVKEYYDNHRDEFERVKVAHVLVHTGSAEKAAPKAPKAKEKPATKHSESEALKIAEQVQERLSKGEDFGKVAKEVSEDERTKTSQGDLGYITIRDKRLERWGWLPLAEKAFAMKVGEVSDVIKTKDGFHIIKVTEAKQLQPFSDAEPGIKFRLQGDIRTQLIGDLKKKYKVSYAQAAKPPQGPQPETAPAPAPEGVVPESGGPAAATGQGESPNPAAGTPPSTATPPTN